jgi:2-octaprenyl-6-methoxyphenol hydroxylase
VGFTDFLVSAFSNDHALTRVPRGLGLAAVDLLPGARRALAQRMMFGGLQ